MAAVGDGRERGGGAITGAEPFRQGTGDSIAVYNDHHVRRAAVADGFGITVTGVRQGDPGEYERGRGGGLARGRVITRPRTVQHSIVTGDDSRVIAFGAGIVTPVRVIVGRGQGGRGGRGDRAGHNRHGGDRSDKGNDVAGDPVGPVSRQYNRDEDGVEFCKGPAKRSGVR